MVIKTMDVLLVINHAPDYRETFLHELGKQVNLTVVAQPCEDAKLAPPKKRNGYKYIETPAIKLFGLFWQPGLNHIIHQKPWDILCFGTSSRNIDRYVLFLKNPDYWNRWIWRGLIYGRKNNIIINVFRKYFFSRSAALLVYSNEVAVRVRNDYGVNAVSFNNTEVKQQEYREGVFKNNHSEIRMLFVGTYKPRKKIERLIELAGRRRDVKIRIVGPGMEKLKTPQRNIAPGKVEIFGRTTGDELNSHFDWADIVVSPGNVGLLVMNAAKHGKGIVIDNKSYHGPEHLLAKETGQPFISFENEKKVDNFIDDLFKNRWKLKKWGNDIQALAKEKYTIEYMALKHVQVFKKVVSKINSKQK
jgi:hypothetical protein